MSTCRRRLTHEGASGGTWFCDSRAMAVVKVGPERSEEGHRSHTTNDDAGYGAVRNRCIGWLRCFGWFRN